ncbi:MAG: phosphodiester glycosidase family protein [Candidatus Eremiobacteraeota bacterium]|nr:phosphodiester glycosidase family protein [Candidatus Eremiobacteraeota bacterium]
MNNLKINKIAKILFLSFLLFCFSNTMHATADNNDAAQVKEIKYGFNKDGIRIVIKLSKECDFDYYSIKDSSKIHLNLFDAKLSDSFRTPSVKYDPLLGKCKIKQYNFRQVKMLIPLKYGLPIDNVDVFKLKKPNRIVIDILRNYNNYFQFHITKNIIWLQIEKASNGRFTLINELYVNQKSPDVTVDVELAKNGGKRRENICSMVKRTGAVAGVNGGYFSKSGQNLGLVVSNGKIVASSVKRRPPRTAFGITFDSKILFNRVSDKNGKLIPMWGKTWKSIVTALGAGPRIIASGKPHISANQEALGKGGNDITRRTGRTAVGATKDGRLVLYTVSAFHSNNKDGMKLEELAAYLHGREIFDAMNLDGGGSTAMSIMGYPVSKAPGHGRFQRPVANAVLIYDKNPIISPYYIAMEPREIVMPADGVSEKILRVLVCDRNEKPVPNKTPLGVISGIGLVSKKYFRTRRGMVDIKIKSVRAPGNYSIKLECGPLRTFIPLKLTYGETTEIVAEVIKPRFSPIDEILKDSNNGKKNGNGDNTKTEKRKEFPIRVLVRDCYKNPLKNIKVRFSVAEGKGDIDKVVAKTGKNGAVKNRITLQQKPAKIMITCAGAKPVYLEFD